MNITFTSNRTVVMTEIQKATDRALEICGGKAESYAKELCPADTGLLRNSITHGRSGRFPAIKTYTSDDGSTSGSYDSQLPGTTDDNTEYICTNVSYAPPVELGHHQEPGRYVPAIGKRLKREWVPGKAFIGPAIENHQEEYKAVFIGEFKKIK